MKKFTLLLLIAFLSCFTNAYAGLVTIESNFTDKDLSVGADELGWTASIAANSFETTSPSRGVQFGSAKGEFTLNSNEGISKFKSITLVMSTNGTDNTMSISVVSNGTPTKILGVTTIQKANNQELTYNYTGAEPLSGIINICINNKAKSVYFKKISVTYEVEDNIPSAPTVSLAAGTYYEAQTLKITAPEGATLVGSLNETNFKNVSEYTATLAAVNEETTTYKLDVCSTKDGVSSDAVSATFVIDPNVIDATVTGVIDMADIDDSNFIKNGANMVSGQEYSINDSYGTKFSFSAVKGGGSNMPFRTASTTAKQCLRLYLGKNSGNVLTIGSEVAISKIAITTGSALKIDGEKIAVNNSVVEKEYAEGCKSFTIEPTTNKQDIYSIAITYSGKVHFDKVKNGAALIGMKKGKLYKVNVALQGIEANGGVLYARTTEPSAAPSEPGKNYFDKSYEDFDLKKFDQRDWVAINGLTSDYEGKEVATGFIASYDGETLTPVAAIADNGDAASYTLNTFGVANVFYGNYKNTETLGMKNDYRPFFVKAKVNEVANYVGEVKAVTGGFELWGSGVCGKLNEKGLEIDANGIEITASTEYKQIEGVLVADAAANGGVKLVALSAPTTPTGVAALKADGKATVYGTEGAVVVNGADGKVMIFDAMGRMVKSVNVEGAATVAMPAGYYIVRTAGTAAKVIVK